MLNPKKMTSGGKELPKSKPSPRRSKLGRNDACPCGSGKKYKNCCWGKRFSWVVDEQGNICREVPIDDPEMRAEFREQHGRDLQPADLLFGDIGDDRDLEKTVTDILERAGVSPAYIYAFKKTRRLVTEWNKDKLTDAELREWQTAVEEYRASEK
jgi:hypothetical protein